MELDNHDRDEDNIHVARMQEIQQMDTFGLGTLVKKDQLERCKILKAIWVDTPRSDGA